MKKSGDSVMETQSLFQVENGGSIPTSPHKFKIIECNFSDIRHIFEEFHYKGGHMGGGISFCLALKFNQELMGGAVMGKPRHQNKYKDLIEIRRMACIEVAPKNSESYFLSKIIWWTKKKKLAKGLLSYSDTSVGHKGTIYKAANFRLIGETAPSLHVFWKGKRYHPRSLTIERPYSHELRKAVKNGDAKIEKGEPKLIFIYP